MTEEAFRSLGQAMLIDGGFAKDLTSDINRLDLIAKGFRGYQFDFSEEELKLIQGIAAQNDPRVLLEKLESIKESLYPANPKGESQ